MRDHVGKLSLNIPTSQCTTYSAEKYGAFFPLSRMYQATLTIRKK